MDARLLSHSQATCSLSGLPVRKHLQPSSRIQFGFCGGASITSHRTHACEKPPGTWRAARCTCSSSKDQHKYSEDVEAATGGCNTQNDPCESETSVLHHFACTPSTANEFQKDARRCRFVGANAATGGAGMPCGSVDGCMRPAGPRGCICGAQRSTAGPCGPSLVCMPAGTACACLQTSCGSPCMCCWAAGAMVAPCSSWHPPAKTACWRR